MESRIAGPAIGLVLILLISLPMNLNSAPMHDQNSSPVIEQIENPAISYTPHLAIRTNGDTELYNLAIADGWPGYGNSTHPWIIEGYSITDWRPIEIGFTSYIFTIRNCLITGTNPNLEYGIRILGTDYTRIENCIISNAAEGIEFWDVQYSTIRNCTTYGCGEFGMYMRYALYCNIYDSEVRDNPHVGINVMDSYDMTLENNSVYGNGYEGILVNHGSGWDSNRLNLVNNTVRNNGGPGYPGLNIIETDYVTATSMTIHNNYDGVLVHGSNSFSLTDSEVFDNDESGVVCSQSTIITIENNIIHSNAFKGVELTGILTCTIEMNEIYDNDESGINVESSDFCDIINNSIYDNLEFGV